VEWVNWIIAGLGVYLGVGLAFGVAFAIAGAGRVSPAARGTGWGFRVLIVPGAAALWPWLAWRWGVGRPDASAPGDGPEGVDPEAETA
jgi:hypothetical protein